jgi:hypothetical protein
VIKRTYKNIKDAWLGAYFAMLNDEVSSRGVPAIDYFQRNIWHSHGNHLVAKQSVFDFDLGEIGLTRTKWSKFTGQYVDVESLHAWVNNAMNVKTYESLWQFKDIPPNFSGKKATHQWGKCLLGFSFRRQPKPATLTLFTRTQSLGFSGVADYALGDFVARRLAERMGIGPEDIEFQVYAPTFIIKVVEVVAFLHQRGLLDQYSQADTRTGEAIRYYIKYMDRPEDEIKWRAARRWRTKFERSKAGIYTPLYVPDLTLKGWHAEGEKRKTEKKRTSREVSELVLMGKGRRPVVEDIAEALG